MNVTVLTGTYTAFSLVSTHLLHIKDVVFETGEDPKIFIYGRLFRKIKFELDSKKDIEKLLRDVSKQYNI